GVHGDAVAGVTATAGERRGVERGGEGSALRLEGVGAAAAVGRLVGPHRGRKAASGGARYVSVASGVHGDAVAVVVATPPEVRGVEEGGTEAIAYCHEVTGDSADGRSVPPRPRR